MTLSTTTGDGATRPATTLPDDAAPPAGDGVPGGGLTDDDGERRWDADEYDLGNRGQFQTALEALMEAGAHLLAGGTMADVGCGSGLLAQAMAARDFSVVATDVSPSMVAATRRRCAGLRVEVSVQDASGLTLEPAGFDVVHSSWMLHWLPDPTGTLATLAAAVRPGGLLVLQWSCAQPRSDGFALRDVIASVFDRPAWRDRLAAAPLGMFQHPLDEVRAALEAAGLEVALVAEDLDVPGGETPDEMRRALRSAAFATQAAVLGDDVDDLIDECLAALVGAGALRVANARLIARRPRHGAGDRTSDRAVTAASVRRFPLSVGELEVVDTVELSPTFRRLELRLVGADPLPVTEPAETLTAIWPAEGADLVLPEVGRWRLPHGTPHQHTANWTVRRYDPTTGLVTVDVHLHDGAGAGAAWAAAAAPGDRVGFGGTRVHWVTDPAAAWVLMVGDETVVPSMAAIADALVDSPLAGRPVIAVIELGDGADRAAFDPTPIAAAALDVRWVRRGNGPGLVDTVASLHLPDGDGIVWGGGELATVRELRRVLVGRHRLDRGRLNLQAYWVASAGT